MVRPTFLIAEPEPPEGLSARKLVLETGKFNVITAYSIPEGVEQLKNFPNVDAVIVHCQLRQDPGSLATEAKKQAPNRKVIALSPRHSRIKDADYHLSSHEPQELLNLLVELYGDPRVAA